MAPPTRTVAHCLLWIGLLAKSAACDGRDPRPVPGPGRPGGPGPGQTVPWWAVDTDGDGWTPSDGDCNDADPAVGPGVVDAPGDGLDHDCDGTDRAARRPELGWTSGDPPDQAVGHALAFGADLDRDGRPELTVAAPSLYADPYVAHTRGTVLQFASPEALRAGTPLAAWSGTDEHDALGAVVAGGGDTDGDGYGELLAAVAYGTAERRPAFLLRDATDPLDGAVRLEGAPGWAIHGLGFGDIDQDGIDDALVLVGGDEGERRLVGVAAPEGTVALEDEDAVVFRIEARVRSFAAADLDGDGRVDLLAAAPEDGDDTGTVLGCAAPTWGADAACAARWTGDRAGDRAGTGLALGGDLDGDGLQDALVGAPTAGVDPPRVGRAYVLAAPLAGGTRSLAEAHAMVTGEVAEDRLGAALHGPGDVDGDGADDLLIGAPSSADSAYGPGRAYLFAGPVAPGGLDPADATAVFAGASLYGAFGAALASGDLDGDGRVDLAFGAPLAHLGSGAVFLVPGSAL